VCPAVLDLKGHLIPSVGRSHPDHGLGGGAARAERRAEDTGREMTSGATDPWAGRHRWLLLVMPGEVPRACFRVRHRLGTVYCARDGGSSTDAGDALCNAACGW